MVRTPPPPKTKKKKKKKRRKINKLIKINNNHKFFKFRWHLPPPPISEKTKKKKQKKNTVVRHVPVNLLRLSENSIRGREVGNYLFLTMRESREG